MSPFFYKNTNKQDLTASVGSPSLLLYTLIISHSRGTIHARQWLVDHNVTYECLDRGTVDGSLHISGECTAAGYFNLCAIVDGVWINNTNIIIIILYRQKYDTVEIRYIFDL